MAHPRARLTGDVRFHDWTVAGGLIETHAGVLLVRNQRRGGYEDWSTPGGVIDADDASLLAGLTREVEEETGLVVREWSGPLYEVRALAPDMGWRMRCEVHLAVAFEGDLRVDDPDGIVVEAAFVPAGRVRRPARVVRAVGARAAERVADANGGSRDGRRDYSLRGARHRARLDARGAHVSA